MKRIKTAVRRYEFFITPAIGIKKSEGYNNRLEVYKYEYRIAFAWLFFRMSILLFERGVQ